jgi:hypothetical protein
MSRPARRTVHLIERGRQGGNEPEAKRVRSGLIQAQVNVHSATLLPCPFVCEAAERSIRPGIIKSLIDG